MRSTLAIGVAGSGCSISRVLPRIVGFLVTSTSSVISKMLLPRPVSTFVPHRVSTARLSGDPRAVKTLGASRLRQPPLNSSGHTTWNGLLLLRASGSETRPSPKRRSDLVPSEHRRRHSRSTPAPVIGGKAVAKVEMVAASESPLLRGSEGGYTPSGWPALPSGPPADGRDAAFLYRCGPGSEWLEHLSASKRPG